MNQLTGHHWCQSCQNMIGCHQLEECVLQYPLTVRKLLYIFNKDIYSAWNILDCCQAPLV